MAASLALFIALGGSAYAVQALPADSVGRTQLKDDAVSAGKIAPNSVGTEALRHGAVMGSDLATGSVGLRTLGPSVKARLTPTAVPGPAGATGAQGPPGPAGPGATRVHFAQDASSSSSLERVMKVGGVEMQAACATSESGVQLTLAVNAGEAVSGVETIAVDSGAGSPAFGEAHTANLQIDLPAGTTPLGGPSANSGEYARVIARLLLVGKHTTVDLDAALVIDATANTCRIDGVAVDAGN